VSSSVAGGSFSMFKGADSQILTSAICALGRGRRQAYNDGFFLLFPHINPVACTNIIVTQPDLTGPNCTILDPTTPTEALQTQPKINLTNNKHMCEVFFAMIQFCIVASNLSCDISKIFQLICHASIFFFIQNSPILE
jgi:hypothetical protein